MSANSSVKAPAVPRKFDYPNIDDYTKIEVGLRIPEQRRDAVGQFAPRRENLPGTRVEWAKSNKFKNGTTMYAVPCEYRIDGLNEGKVPIPAEFDGAPVREIFDADLGCLMIKIVSAQNNGYFVVPARYLGFKFPGLFDYDRVQARRDNGDFLYSIPVHNLVKSDRRLSEADRKRGFKHEFFFFLIRIQGKPGQEREWATLQIDRLTVTRGQDHFRIVLEKEYDGEDNNGLVPIQINKIEAIAERVEVLQGLPIAQAFNRYLENLDRKD